MKITLRKVGRSPFEFEKEQDQIKLKGFLQYDKEKLILMDAKLSGTLTTECAICAEEFDLEVDEELKLYISDGVFVDEKNSMIDVVEAKDGQFDVDEFLNSEIELIKSDYHCCEFCEMGED
ncbi:hypothetical protein MNB_SM-7-83 [hydrothermal vent metagenome]|uniref:DUF177 domain-containing protein n=1 Tax=hydrothermal vent metagenome TaxID=652676 RepID=A0A1W1C0L1_9ZZZZ